MVNSRNASSRALRNTSHPLLLSLLSLAARRDTQSYEENDERNTDSSMGKNYVPHFEIHTTRVALSTLYSSSRVVANVFTGMTLTAIPIVASVQSNAKEKKKKSSNFT